MGRKGNAIATHSVRLPVGVRPARVSHRIQAAMRVASMPSPIISRKVQ